MEKDKEKFLNEIYGRIDNLNKKHGSYKKCELHIHTPESKCYRFITPEELLDSDKDLDEEYQNKDKSLADVLEYARQIDYITNEVYEEMINNIESYERQNVVRSINKKEVKYKSFKEYMIYQLITFKLFKEGINVAVISDHNTINGYDKLLCTIEEFYNRTSIYKNHKLTLILGVEISCSDKNHLMVIIGNDKRKELENILDDIIMGDNLGSFYDTRTIIKKMKKLNPILYIAHANSSDFYGNRVYKEELLNLEALDGFGMKNIVHQQKIIERTKKFNSGINRKAFVLEADSHSINEIGRKNAWIKMSKVNFNSLKKAFINSNICISNVVPDKTDIQIKGLIVERGSAGFLGPIPTKNNKDKYMVIHFSSDLNCIIGGKGTGKSTILNMLEIIYSRECDNLEMLKFISKHKRIYSIFTLNNEEYILYFIPQVKEYLEVTTMNFYKEKEGKYILGQEWYNLFKINMEDNNRGYEQVDSSLIPEILKKVFKRGYNINKLVNKIHNDDISNYIREVFTNTVYYNEIYGYIRKVETVNRKSLFKIVRESINEITELINKRQELFINTISKFNEENDKILQIKYKPININNSVINGFINIFEERIDSFDYQRYTNEEELERHIGNTYVTWGILQNYFRVVIEKKDFFEVLLLILDNKLTVLDKKIPLNGFLDEALEYKDVEKGYVSLNTEKIKEINRIILNKLRANNDKFIKIIIESFKVVDKFEILFNVNYREENRSLPVQFKEISTLSSGQKVAALLKFVFNLGILTNDNTPLIIDQPEDNLDNTYIYKTLVESLKSIKNRRQVIIVTHSSTVVINADAEEVIVMKAENQKGWIEKYGYPSEKDITNLIVNYLEGGQDAFKHKYEMYKTIINI